MALYYKGKLLDLLNALNLKDKNINSRKYRKYMFKYTFKNIYLVYKM